MEEVSLITVLPLTPLNHTYIHHSAFVVFTVTRHDCREAET